MTVIAGGIILFLIILAFAVDFLGMLLMLIELNLFVMTAFAVLFSLAFYFSPPNDNTTWVTDQPTWTMIAIVLAFLCYLTHRGRAALKASRARKACANFHQTYRVCPRCAETVLKRAHVCKHCGHEFAPNHAAPNAELSTA
jgi:hypothetical protein